MKTALSTVYMKKGKVYNSALPYIYILVLLFGLLYSQYLTNYTVAIGAGIAPPCSEQAFFDCGKNLTTSYGKVFGLPVSVFSTALFAFLIVYVLVRGLIQQNQPKVVFALPLLLGYAAGGVSLYYVFVSLFILKSLCIYCSVLYVLIALTIAIAYRGVKTPLRSQPALIWKELRDTLRGRWLSVRLVVIVSLVIAISHIIAQAAIVGRLEPEAVHSGSSAVLSSIFPRKTLPKVMVFSDFECPACRQQSFELAHFHKEHPGEIEVEFVNFPLSNECNPLINRSLHPNACLAAKIGIVMKKRGKFWEYHDRMFAGPRLTETQIYKIVEALGESRPKIEQAAESQEVKEALEQDIKLGIEHQVYSTPTLVVNGEKIVGIFSLEKLASMLSKEIR